MLNPGSGMDKNQDPGINIPDPQLSRPMCAYSPFAYVAQIGTGIKLFEMQVSNLGCCRITVACYQVCYMGYHYLTPDYPVPFWVKF